MAVRLHRVTWSIDVHARGPREAARRAQEIQRNPESIATVFDVRDAQGRVYRVDLLERRSTKLIAQRSNCATV